MTFACTKLFSRNDKLPGFLAFESLTEAGDTIASRLYFTDYPFPPRHPLLHNAKLIPIPLDPSLTSCCFLGQVRIFEFYRAHRAHPFQPPLAVVDVHKAPDRLSHLLQVLEHQAIDNLLLEGPDEAFRHAVGLGLLDKGEAGVDAPVFKLVLEVIRQVLGTVVHPQGQTPAGVCRH